MNFLEGLGEVASLPRQALYGLARPFATGFGSEQGNDPTQLTGAIPGLLGMAGGMAMGSPLAAALLAGSAQGAGRLFAPDWVKKLTPQDAMAGLGYEPGEQPLAEASLALASDPLLWTAMLPGAAKVGQAAMRGIVGPIGGEARGGGLEALRPGYRGGNYQPPLDPAALPLAMQQEASSLPLALQQTAQEVQGLGAGAAPAYPGQGQPSWMNPRLNQAVPGMDVTPRVTPGEMMPFGTPGYLEQAHARNEAQAVMAQLAEQAQQGSLTGIESRARMPPFTPRQAIEGDMAVYDDLMQDLAAARGNPAGQAELMRARLAMLGEMQQSHRGLMATGNTPPDLFPLLSQGAEDANVYRSLGQYAKGGSEALDPDAVRAAWNLRSGYGSQEPMAVEGLTAGRMPIPEVRRLISEWQGRGIPIDEQAVLQQYLQSVQGRAGVQTQDALMRLRDLSAGRGQAFAGTGVLGDPAMATEAPIWSDLVFNYGAPGQVGRSAISPLASGLGLEEEAVAAALAKAFAGAQRRGVNPGDIDTGLITQDLLPRLLRASPRLRELPPKSSPV